MERKRRARHEGIDRLEQVRARVAHDEHRFLPLARIQVVVIDQGEVGSVRRNDAAVQREVLGLRDGVELAPCEPLVELREVVVDTMSTPGGARRSRSRSAAMP